MFESLFVSAFSARGFRLLGKKAAFLPSCTWEFLALAQPSPFVGCGSVLVKQPPRREAECSRLSRGRSASVPQ